MIRRLWKFFKKIDTWILEAIYDEVARREENNEFWRQRKRILQEEVIMEMSIGQHVTFENLNSGLLISGTLIGISPTEYTLDTPCGLRYLKKHLFTIKK